MKDWLQFGGNLVAALVVIVVTALLLNLTGDCAPNVTDCGEMSRRLSVAILAFGLIGVGYYAVLFISQRRKR
jgi:hypothetical protein